MAFSFSRAQWISIVIGAALVGGAVGGVVGTVAAPSLREPFAQLVRQTFPTRPASSASLAVPPTVVPSPGIAEDEQSIAVVSRVQAAVVSIIISKDISKMRSDVVDPFFGQDGALPPGGMEQIGGGSGFFVSPDGLIVTNKHVVEDEQASYTVVTRDGKKLPVESIVRDPLLDLAVLRVQGSGYPTLEFGDSSDLHVGQTVLAIGNALDEFRNTVTKGIVSGLNRRITADGGVNTVILDEAIQTDAAINPGNSGGPLIDLHGHVIGVNTAVSGDGQLIGFAMPGNMAKRDAENVLTSGKIVRPFIGVRYLIIDDALIERNQLSVDHGVLVARGDARGDVGVIPGSPADKAGIKENDILLSFNGTPITVDRTLGALMSEHQPGDVVTLHVRRAGREFDLSLTLGEYKTPTK